MPTSHHRPTNKHSKRKTHRRKAQRRILHGLLLVFAALMLCFGLFLGKAALELHSARNPQSRPQRMIFVLWWATRRTGWQ